MFTEKIHRIDRYVFREFMYGFLCPNNSRNEYNSKDHKQTKQLYLMWIIQGNKPLFNTPRYEGPPELIEQEKLLVLELEA